MSTKLSLFSRPIYVGKNKDVLKCVNATIFEDLPRVGGQVIIPVSLLKIQREPFTAVGQPMYVNQRTNQKQVSRLTVHLDGASADRVAELLPSEFLWNESKRIGTDKVATYELEEDGKTWKHIEDRPFGAETMTKEDADHLDSLILYAKAALGKAQAAAQEAAVQATAAASGAATPAASATQKKLEAFAAGSQEG